jgi:hypothetical protein
MANKYFVAAKKWEFLESAYGLGEDDDAGVVIAPMVYQVLYGKPDYHVTRDFAHPIELCEYIFFTDHGRSPTPTEMMLIVRQMDDPDEGVPYSPDGQIYKETKTFRVFKKIVHFLPTLILIIGLAAIFFRPFSWVVCGLAIVARFEFEYTQRLANVYAPSALIYGVISFLLMPASLVVSIMHLSGYVQFY